MTKIEQKLKKLLKESNNELEKYVIEDLIKKEEETGSDYGAKGYIKDLWKGGCQSGMVNDLIYYKDTSEFFRLYESEIDELKLEMEADYGEPIKIGTPITNWLAWFGYEEMIRKVANKIGIEI